MAKKQNTPVATKKRQYSTDVREKVKNGKRWRLQLDIDHDNTESILNDIETSPTGGEYNKLINGIVRLYYKKQKRVKK